jgi:hypothetical protein
MHNYDIHIHLYTDLRYVESLCGRGTAVSIKYALSQ